MEIYNPSHPGEILKELCLTPHGLSVTETAQALDVARKTLSELINGKAGVSPEMALRLSKAFRTAPEFWLNLQQQYDLWHTKQRVGELQVRELGEPYSAYKLFRYIPSTTTALVIAT
jgi:antitoxin HigA-1